MPTSSGAPVSNGRTSDAGQTDDISTERGADFCTEGCNGDETDNSDQPDQHTIFDQGRPVLIPVEAVDQFAHLTFTFPKFSTAPSKRKCGSNAADPRPTRQRSHSFRCRIGR